MANGVLGLGSGQASALNSDLIEKLKTAERKSTVAPIETRIENITAEKEIFSNIETKVSELLAAIKPFDLFISGGMNAFEQKTAATSGDSVTFDADDVTSLEKGFTSVNVTKIAKKDVYQSDLVTSSQKDVAFSSIGDLTISVNGISSTFITTGKTYTQLAEEINAKTGISASLEQVGTDDYRLIIKSEETGLSNKLTISGSASSALGLDDLASNIVPAQNLEATVDGVNYNVSSNILTVNGLKITAIKEGSSSINIAEDSTQLETQMNNFITKYNELVALVEVEVQSSDNKLGDRSAIRSIVTGIKDKLFGSYGSSEDKSIFNFGLEIDRYGSLSLNSTKFNDSIKNDMTGLKELFIGTAEKKGLGTTLKESIDEMTYTGGILNIYEKGISTRETTLNTEKTTAEKLLDKKYELLSAQFVAYGTVINQMESAFSGLKMMIEQSAAGN